MRAIRISDPGVVDFVDAPIPRPPAGEVLVRVETAALCATDRKLAARGSDPPRVPGHEFAGRLEDGTPVGVHPDLGCGRCPACLAGLENRCPLRRSIGLDRDGGLAECVTVPERHVVALDGVDLAVAPILEPLACCLHAVSLLRVTRGDDAVVVGAGSMGILCMWALQEAGATVAVCQRSAKRRNLAEQLGAEATLAPDQRADEALGTAPRIAVVTAPGADALAWALENVRFGGIVHAFAGTPEGAPVDANVIHYRHLSLVGSTGSGLADYARARDLVNSGKIPLERLPRRTIALESAPEALLGEPEMQELKVVIDVGGGTG